MKDIPIDPTKKLYKCPDLIGVFFCLNFTEGLTSTNFAEKILTMGLQIVKYTPQYKDSFKQLNVEWISTYFRMEKADYDSLDDPEGYILNKGGEILVALLDNKVAGVCALIKMQDEKYDFELAKMAVSPTVHGKGIGYQLGLACIEEAKEMGVQWLYLESNTILEPAINLYRKLGFTEITGRETPYERCNIQMELQIR